MNSFDADIGWVYLQEHHIIWSLVVSMRCSDTWHFGSSKCATELFPDASINHRSPWRRSLTAVTGSTARRIAVGMRTARNSWS
jgi:hypothetical protein